MPCAIVCRCCRRDDVFSRFDPIPSCDRQTDRQRDTGRQRIPRQRSSRDNIFLPPLTLFTARRCASAVYAVVTCPSVCSSVCPSVTSWYRIETTDRIELVLTRELFSCCEKIRVPLEVRVFFFSVTSFRTLDWKFRHDKSIALSTKLVDERACWRHLRRSTRRRCLLHVGQL